MILLLKLTIKMGSRRKAQGKYNEKMPTIGVRIEKEVKEEIEKIAKSEGISKTEWVRKALKFIVSYKKTVSNRKV